MIDTDGFTLEQTRWDSLPLDDFFFANKDTLSQTTRARLKKAGYLRFVLPSPKRLSLPPSPPLSLSSNSPLPTSLTPRPTHLPTAPTPFHPPPQYSNSHSHSHPYSHSTRSYTLDPSGVCHRTQVAVRALTMPPARWKRFVDGRDTSPSPSNTTTPSAQVIAADTYITTHILLIYFQEACRAIRDLRMDPPPQATPVTSVTPALLPEDGDVRDVLVRRWVEIREMVLSAFRNGINEVTRAEMEEVFSRVAAEREGEEEEGVLGDWEEGMEGE